MQTNIKLVEFGKDLKIQVKKIKLQGEHLSSKQMQSLCNKLSIAATPYYEQNSQYMLVKHKDNLIKDEIKIDEWTIKLIPTNDNLELCYRNKEDRNAIKFIKEVYCIKFREQKNFGH